MGNKQKQNYGYQPEKLNEGYQPSEHKGYQPKTPNNGYHSPKSIPTPPNKGSNVQPSTHNDK